MPTNAINYIDAKTFLQATAVFIDSELTTLASDGFYSDS